MSYRPELNSLRSHPLPDWYDDAKFGIFIHWSPSCVPAFAPVRSDMAELLDKEGEVAMFANTPYAEWYQNSLLIPGSPVARHHAETYGEDYAYDNFVEEFRSAMKAWDPQSWADLIVDSGARYTVLVTKHHDGVTLFQSRTPHPTKQNWQASRDVVKELTEAVRVRGLRMGYYYSGSVDWSFYHEPITDFLSLAVSGSPTQEYADYVDSHYRELMEYKPDVLWNDIGYPANGNLFQLFADYYNDMPEGVVNDRWLQTPGWLRGLIQWPVTRRVLRWLLSLSSSGSEGIEPPKPPHSDYSTPEYTVKKEISERKWECVRGIGKSFGYNAQETEADFPSREELIHMLIDIVSKNGNLLLNIGPKPDGSIPDVQKDRLLAIGQWLKLNGEGIYGSRPWDIPSSVTSDGLEVRFTQGDGVVYLFFLGQPHGTVTLSLPFLQLNQLHSATGVSLLESSARVEMNVQDDLLHLTADWTDSIAPCIAFRKND